jgi:hypothetical protein
MTEAKFLIVALVVIAAVAFATLVDPGAVTDLISDIQREVTS